MNEAFPSEEDVDEAVAREVAGALVVDAATVLALATVRWVPTDLVLELCMVAVEWVADGVVLTVVFVTVRWVADDFVLELAAF
mmetsp:Transcript_52195/g.96605  ORF Transcript_52195/g.96605 Transcript_52195/m.96605 type:complete len:83 (+) Transcript_52195:410-658(+)